MPMLVAGMTKEQLTRVLAYAGLVLVAFELVKSLVVKPIRDFYSRMTWGPGMPFTTYENDVLSRHKDQFEASLLYLRDFMQAIDKDDFAAIQDLRRHRNALAHALTDQLYSLKVSDYGPLLERSTKALFKLSNHDTYMEVGADPAFRDVDWNTAVGNEYILLEEILRKVNILQHSATG